MLKIFGIKIMLHLYFPKQNISILYKIFSACFLPGLTLRQFVNIIASIDGKSVQIPYLPFINWHSNEVL